MTKTNTPTMARTLGGSTVWHDLNRATGPGTSRPWHTMCGRNATMGMAIFNPADLPSGERSHKACARCRKARGV